MTPDVAPNVAGNAAPRGTERIALALYSLALRLLQPAYALRLRWRARAEPGYGQAVGERFGFYAGAAPAPGAVWLHAVSLGETRAAGALIEALRAELPGMRLVLTHGTATGREAGTELLRDGDVQAWLPVDTPGAVGRFLDRYKPRIGVLMETEIWPNLLDAARRRGLPMVLANARLSERSQRRGQRLSALMTPAARSVTRVLAQSAADAQRLRAAGAPDVRVCGNLKFDMTPDPALLERGRAWRELLRPRAVLLAAITREGEEAMLLAAWARAAWPAGVEKPLLVIVPRHPQRFDEVAALIEAAGLTLARRSRWQDRPDDAALQADSWLGDSMREMPAYYALADLALLGGSYAPLGGQNLIEAAACGCPVVMGPHTFNFAQAAELALEAGAAARVDDLDAALRVAASWLADPATLAQASSAAVGFAAQHRGAAARMAGEIAELVDGRAR